MKFNRQLKQFVSASTSATAGRLIASSRARNGLLHLRLLGDFEGVLHLDSQVADGALDSMASWP